MMDKWFTIKEEDLELFFEKAEDLTAGHIKQVFEDYFEEREDPGYHE